MKVPDTEPGTTLGDHGTSIGQTPSSGHQAERPGNQSPRATLVARTPQVPDTPSYSQMDVQNQDARHAKIFDKSVDEIRARRQIREVRFEASEKETKDDKLARVHRLQERRAAAEKNHRVPNIQTLRSASVANRDCWCQLLHGTPPGQRLRHRAFQPQRRMQPARRSHHRRADNPTRHQEGSFLRQRLQRTSIGSRACGERHHAYEVRYPRRQSGAKKDTCRFQRQHLVSGHRRNLSSQRK
jgi:hypothetical protein